MNILILFLLLYNRLSTNTELLILFLLLCSNNFDSNQSRKNIDNNGCNLNSYYNPKKPYNNNPNQNNIAMNKKYNTKKYTKPNSLYANTNTYPPKKEVYYCYDNLGNLIPYKKHSDSSELSNNPSGNMTYTINNNLTNPTDFYLSEESPNSNNLRKGTTYYCYDDLGNLIPYEKYNKCTTSNESNIFTNYVTHIENNNLNNSTCFDLSEEFIDLETSHEQIHQHYYDDFKTSNTYKEKNSSKSTKDHKMNSHINTHINTQNDYSLQKSNSIEEKSDKIHTKALPQMPPYLEGLKIIGTPLKELTKDINSPFQNISSLQNNLTPLNDLTKMDSFSELSDLKEILIPIEDFKSE